MLLLVWIVCPNPTRAQRQTTLTLIIRDAADRPVVGLVLTVADAGGARQLATMDTAGRATVTGLRGPSVTLTHARTAADQPLRLDPTTPRDGLVLGLIPGAARVVRLRLDGDLLFVDPQDVFAGTDAAPSSPTPARMGVAMPATAAPAAASIAAPTPADGAAPPDAPDGLRHGLLVLGGLLGLAVGAACLRAVFFGREGA